MSAKSPSFDGHLVDAGFTTADTDVSVSHDLERIPLAAFVVSPPASDAGIYKGSVSWTTTTVSLRASAPASVTLLLI